jgi:hypothetical protein
MMSTFVKLIKLYILNGLVFIYELNNDKIGLIFVKRTS